MYTSIKTNLSSSTQNLHRIRIPSYLAAQWLHVVILYFPIHWLQHNHPILEVHHHCWYIGVGSLKTFQWTHLLLGNHSCNCKQLAFVGIPPRHKCFRISASFSPSAKQRKHRVVLGILFEGFAKCKVRFMAQKQLRLRT